MVVGKWIYFLWVGVKYGESFFLFSEIDGLCIVTGFFTINILLNKILGAVDRLNNFKYSRFVS